MKNLILTIQEGIATITINREKKLNALNFETLAELKQVFEDLSTQREVSVIILTGQGEKSFVAGADINEIHTLDKEKAEEVVTNAHHIFNAIEQFPKPVIAAVNGFALGGGCELAMACHMRFASENAQFAQPEINLGIIPGYGGTQRLTHLVGKGKAIELMLSADYISAQEAKRIGLVNDVLESQEELYAHCRKLAKKLSEKPKIATKLIIDAVNAHYQFDKDGFAQEIKNFAECCSTDDFKEGTQAFMEKRKANFKNNS
ncbi:MAG: enoyl-CoA hydratase [Cytophagales bacterium]|nr:enoyl-CoA hydratase [Cytophagales bacterium]